MAQKIKIANIEIKEGEKDGKPWKRFVITSEDKSVVTTFDNNASSLRVGDVIEAEIELRGKYTNIKEFKTIEKASPETPAVKPDETKKPPYNRDDAISEQRTSIERQVSAKLAFEFANGNIKLREVLNNAEVIFQWIHKKLLPEASPSEPEKSSPAAVEEETNIISPTDELLNKVCEAKSFKTTKTARTFLLNVCHIEESRIDSEPEKVWQEVKLLL